MKINAYFKIVSISVLILFISISGLSYAQAYRTTKVSNKEWTEIKTKFKKQYASKKPEDRIEALKLIEPCWGWFISKKDSLEATQILIDILSNEKEPTVITATISSAPRMARDKESVKWIEDNFSSPKNDGIRLYLAEIIARFGNWGGNKNTELMKKICMDKDPAVSATVIKIMKTAWLNHDFTEILLSMIEDSANMTTADKGSQIAFNALDEITQMDDYRLIPALINLLSSEKRTKVKEKISETLESITKQSFGENKDQWTKWWRERAQRDVTIHEINAAIRKGKEYLLQSCSLTATNYITSSYTGELVFYTLLHAGVSPDNSIMQSAINYFITKKLTKTYQTSLLAMALSDMEDPKYIPKLIQCAQFLLGNESEDGTWSYGEAVPDEFITPMPAIKNNEANEEKDPHATVSRTKSIRIKTPPRRKMKPEEKRLPYDNSNTQYAILGLRACAEARIEIPKDAWEDAERYLLRAQARDGGWGYTAGSTGYGSMTAGGLCSLIITMHYQGKEFSNNASVKRAVEWLANNFAVTENPKAGSFGVFHGYYLYALERAGVIAQTESFGKNMWYQEGAKYLLMKQKKDGNWNLGRSGTYDNITDTCFAILFLKRATKLLPPLKAIETGK